MSIPCPQCGREYDVTLFQFGNEVGCVCGKRIALSHRVETIEEIRSRTESGGEDEDRSDD